MGALSRTYALSSESQGAAPGAAHRLCEASRARQTEVRLSRIAMQPVNPRKHGASDFLRTPDKNAATRIGSCARRFWQSAGRDVRGAMVRPDGSITL